MRQICIVVLELLLILALLQIIRDMIIINVGIVKYGNYHKVETILQQKNIYIPDLCVMIAALNEYKELIDTIKWIKTIPYPGKLEIYIVTSNKEKCDVKKTTMDFIDEYITNEGGEEIIHIHCPEKDGNKASQLNYVLKREKSRLLKSRSYIAIYDADSRPEKETFSEFIEMVNRVKIETGKLPVVIQQPSLFLKNYNKIPWTMKIEAVCMMRRVFGIEIPNMVKTQNRNRKIPVYSYCVGHGMFVKTSFLYENGLLPEPHEDVPFGQKMCIKNIPIYPLPAFDNCEVAKSLKELIRQSGRWFLNSLLVWKIVKQELENPMSSKFRTICMAIKGLNDTFTWAHYAISLFNTCLLIILNRLPLYFLGILISLWYLDVGIGSIIVMCNKVKTQVNITYRMQVLNFLLSPMRELLRFIGVIKGIIYMIRGTKSGIVNVMPKAER